MPDIQSSVTELPDSCKSAAERTARFLKEEDRYVDLTPSCCDRLTALEQEIERETGEQVALVAYRI